MLRELNLKAVYRTEVDNLLEDFYIPVLRSSTRYDRAVGFFSAGMISYAAQGLTALIEKNGRMRLIVGGELDAEDAEAIRKGYDCRDLSAKLGVKLLTVLENITDTLCYRRLEALSWMIANGNLDVKIALKQRGMYHEKIGILTDSNGDQIVFQGSANETVNALLPDFNFESLNVFPTWKAELKEHYLPYIDGFERLWNNNARRTIVLDFPEAAKERLLKIAKTAKKPRTEVEIDLWQRLVNLQKVTGSGQEPAIPITLGGQEFSLMEHQRRALNEWKAHVWRGILAMATGSGKTITALYGVVRIFQSMRRMFLVIAVPYQVLADQWVTELRNFGIAPIPSYGSLENWQKTLMNSVHLYETKTISFVCTVVVNRTLVSEEFQQLLRQIHGEHLVFIGDECHHHRAPKAQAALPQQAAFRLGLSATPESGFDLACDGMVDYYGPVVFHYGIENALADGVLTPYMYHVHLVDLTASEAEDYEELSSEITKLMAAEKNVEFSDDLGSPRLKLLLIQRSRLLGAAANKILALRNLLTGVAPQPLSLFYCGDGSVDDEVSGDSYRQIEAVSRALHTLGWRTMTFTAVEGALERQGILDNFRLALIDGIVAIRCLDEGVDIPACKNAYILASARSPRQFIQRRGRILRRFPGKDFAVIHDLVVRIPDQLCTSVDVERQLFASELNRIAIFARSAMNPADAYRTIESLLKRLDLEHRFV